MSASRDFECVQALLVERGITLTHETVRAWRKRFAPTWPSHSELEHPPMDEPGTPNEVRVVLGGVVHWLWRAVNECGEVLEILLQAHRDTGAAKRFCGCLLDRHDGPDVIVTDKFGSDGAAIGDLNQLEGVVHEYLRADARLNNQIEPSHRPTRDQERGQRGFRSSRRAQAFP